MNCIFWYYALENSLRREIKEEAGIEVGKIKLDHESVSHAWATCEELHNHDLIEGIADEIKMVDELIIKN